MIKNPNYIPSDEIVLCDAHGDCIEARGENAKAIVNAVCFVALCLGIAALLKTIK